MIYLSFSAHFNVGHFEVLRPWHRTTQRHQRIFSFHDNTIRRARQPRNLVRKHRTHQSHPVPNHYSFSLLPLTPSPRHKNFPVPFETLLALHTRSPRFLRQPNTSISKTVSSKTCKFGGSVERLPLEEHEPTYTTRTKPLKLFPIPISTRRTPLPAPAPHSVFQLAFSNAVINPFGHSSSQA